MKLSDVTHRQGTPMKSRELFTIHDLIASNYTITKLTYGNYLHKFTPATTATVYEFEANATPIIVEGERYNIGYTLDSEGRNIIDLPDYHRDSASFNRRCGIGAVRQPILTSSIIIDSRLNR